MRKLKFRFWKDKKIQGILELKTNGILDVPWEWDVVDQFTGLLDKQGREVYEGDIVKYVLGNKSDAWNGIVQFTIKWSDDYFGWAGDGNKPLSGFAMDESWKLEVVGNISGRNNR